MFEMAEKHGLHSCFECGLCAFSCTMRRPLLQYIRFAKDQLRAAGRSEQA
jgi:electron transport complex protein RnfC